MLRDHAPVRCMYVRVYDAGRRRCRRLQSMNFCLERGERTSERAAWRLVRAGR